MAALCPAQEARQELTMYESFFAYARERHATYLRRQAGLPRDQWTQDPILRQYRFCNIFRELDTTTRWWRQTEQALVSPDHAILATALFRWFNRITTGEAIFRQPSIGLDDEQPGETAWDAFVRTRDVGFLRAAILTYCDGGPYVTGSYIIKTPNGMDKLDGVLACVEWLDKMIRPTPVSPWNAGIGWEFMTEAIRRFQQNFRLELVWNWLRKFPYMGDFMAYEVVTDLRHGLLFEAPDVMTWANAGPGAMRGLNRIHGRPLDYRSSKHDWCAEMQDILRASRDHNNWPVQVHDSICLGWYASGWIPELYMGSWPYWEMREVEHTLCEFDKMERVRLGQGKPRNVLR